MLPSPQVFGVLASLPPVNLSALELGMQQFLEELDRIAPDLASPRTETGLCLWIVAAAGAADQGPLLSSPE